MKVVKYYLKAKIEKVGKGTITIERKFRKLINVRKFIDELIDDEDVKCTPLNKSENLMTKQCEGDGIKYFFEITTERVKKVKKEESKGQKSQPEVKEEKQSTS